LRGDASHMAGTGRYLTVVSPSMPISLWLAIGQ
jgi:hypothetical protein